MGKSKKSTGQAALSSGATLYTRELFTAWCRPNGDPNFYRVTVYVKQADSDHWRITLQQGGDPVNPFRADWTTDGAVRRLRDTINQVSMLPSGGADYKIPAHGLLPDALSGFTPDNEFKQSIWSQMPASKTNRNGGESPVKPIETVDFSKVLIQLASSNMRTGYGQTARDRFEFTIQLFADQLMYWVEDLPFAATEINRKLDQHKVATIDVFRRKIGLDTNRVNVYPILPEVKSSQE